MINFLFISLTSMTGCKSKGKEKMIEEYIQNDLKVGQVVRVTDLTKVTHGMVCTLYPYQSYIDEKVPQSVHINAYLKASGYIADESHWAFVIAETETVNLYQFKRSRNLDILASHEIQSEHKTKLPEHFKPANCASLENAIVTKIESKNRFFLIMGEIK
ncbi:hypothetical protein [Xylella fastidiosa]|uniref:hypothetical protein n=1 Tax=Xylella fastidiosa TaxID=2371 RepID=UPI0012ACC266|nr:hypothetical protein [Xylella fastidiosa]MDC7970222.1 hypothetical protein [Xylella fastidiosa subsp. multiplex]